MWNEAAMVDAGLKIMECWKLQTKSINCRLKTGMGENRKSIQISLHHAGWMLCGSFIEVKEIWWIFHLSFKDMNYCSICYRLLRPILIHCSLLLNLLELDWLQRHVIFITDGWSIYYLTWSWWSKINELLYKILNCPSLILKLVFHFRNLLCLSSPWIKS